MREQVKEHKAKPHQLLFSDNHWILGLFLAASIFIDAFVNAFSFSEGAELGYLDGLLTASFISVILTASGYLGGLYGWRYLEHPNPKGVSWGIFCTVTSALGALFFIGMAADYRCQIVEHNEAQLDFSLLPEPDKWFGLYDFKSFLIIGLGLFIFLLNGLKGSARIKTIVAQCPGYAGLKRQEIRATRKVEELRRGAHKEVKARIQNGLKLAEADLQEAVAAKEAVQTLVSEAEKISLTHFESCKTIAQRGITALKHIWHIWQDMDEVRATPLPAYTRNPPHVQDYLPPALDLTTLYKNQDAIVEAVSQKRAALQQAKRQLTKRHKLAIQQLDALFGRLKNMRSSTSFTPIQKG